MRFPIAALSVLLLSLQIAPDARTNTLIVQGSVADMELAKKLIDRFDAPASETKPKR